MLFLREKGYLQGRGGGGVAWFLFTYYSTLYSTYHIRVFYVNFLKKLPWFPDFFLPSILLVVDRTRLVQCVMVWVKYCCTACFFVFLFFCFRVIHNEWEVDMLHRIHLKTAGAGPPLPPLRGACILFLSTPHALWKWVVPTHPPTRRRCLLSFFSGLFRSWICLCNDFFSGYAFCLH